MSASPLPPVVLIVFNRPDLTAAAMQRLARVRPERLLVVADGPRDAAEAGLCERTLATVRDGITWPGQVDWCVSDTNLGCSERVNSGLDWVFERVDRAVILEDDIEVAEGFFPFAADALTRWRDDPSVGAVSARNELIDFAPAHGALLVRRCGIWGWATWADRWQDYRTRFPEAEPGLLDLLPHDQAPLLSRLHAHFLTRREWETSGVWDIAWTAWQLTHGQRTVVPPGNMSVNHGFRSDGTHTAVAGDLRGAFPLVPADATRPDPGVDYDDAATLIDIMMLFAQPRRWRVMAEAMAQSEAPEAMQIMLEPWRRRSDSQAALEKLARHIDSPHLDELRAAFA